MVPRSELFLNVRVAAIGLFRIKPHVVGAVVFLQDITESRKIEADLEERITRVVSTGVDLEATINL